MKHFIIFMTFFALSGFANLSSLQGELQRDPIGGYTNASRTQSTAKTSQGAVPGQSGAFKSQSTIQSSQWAALYPRSSGKEAMKAIDPEGWNQIAQQGGPPVKTPWGYREIANYDSAIRAGTYQSAGRIDDQNWRLGAFLAPTWQVNKPSQKIGEQTEFPAVLQWKTFPLNDSAVSMTRIGRTDQLKEMVTSYGSNAAIGQDSPQDWNRGRDQVQGVLKSIKSYQPEDGQPSYVGVMAPKASIYKSPSTVQSNQGTSYEQPNGTKVNSWTDFASAGFGDRQALDGKPRIADYVVPAVRTDTPSYTQVFQRLGLQSDPKTIVGLLWYNEYYKMLF